MHKLRLDECVLDEELHHWAKYDNLTGIPNRMSFECFVTRALLDDEQRFAIGLIDLDGFKEINDTLGHQAGDQFLKDTSAQLMHLLRDNDIAARLGGDEFALLIYGDNLEEGTEAVSRRLLKGIASIPAGKLEGMASASIGWSFYPDDGRTYSELLGHADDAMFAVKKAGKSGWTTYGGAVREKVAKRATMRNMLPISIASGHIRFHLQPQCDLDLQCISGVEMLVRWAREDGRWLPARDFIVLLEEDAYLSRILGISALLEANSLRERLPEDIRISVNIGEKHLLNRDFMRDIQEFLPDGNRITLEIKEKAALKDLSKTVKLIQHLTKLGFSVSLDNVGKSGASLVSIAHLDIKEMKIDKSLIHQMRYDYRVFNALAGITHMGRMSSIRMVAEGVSTGAELRTWHHIGGHTAQGYLISPPLPENAFMTWRSALSRVYQPQQDIRQEPNLAVYTHLNDPMPHTGGQPLELYPLSKWIRQGLDHGETACMSEYKAIEEALSRWHSAQQEQPHHGSTKIHERFLRELLINHLQRCNPRANLWI
ncbi:EAL domain-containing protein [Acidithiobacillus ferrivorans]|nr:EAL domain-containing protein [Acidithiobacillus ferrivorans]